MSAPRVASSPGELLGLPVRHRPRRGRAPRHRATRPPSATAASATSSGRPRSARTRPPSRPPAGSSGRPPRSWARPSASIHELYMARARGEYSGFTVPAINLRTQVFDMAARGLSARPWSWTPGSVIFELARSEQEYTFQRPAEYITSVLAGCHRGRLARSRLRAGRPLPVQRGQVQGRPRGRHGDPAQGHRQRVVRGLRQHRHRLLDAGGPLVRVRSTSSRRSTTRAPRSSRRSSARDQDDGLVVSIGGEIGEVGKQNSTPDELRAYLDGYRRELDARAGADAIGLSKVSVQTGTSHGGVPLPGGGVAEVKLDFETLKVLGEVCPRVRPGGCRPARRLDAARRALPSLPAGRDRRDPPGHGLPERALRAPGLPGRAVRRDRGASASTNCADERKDGETDTQFVYKTRKKALGTFKRRALGAGDEGRDHRQPAGQDAVPLRAARPSPATAPSSTASSRRPSATSRCRPASRLTAPVARLTPRRCRRALRRGRRRSSPGSPGSRRPACHDWRTVRAASDAPSGRPVRQS